MNSDVLNDLENKIDRAVGLIVDLRKEKEKLEIENHSLKQELKSLKSKIEEQTEKLKNDFSGFPGSDGDSSGREIKKRLRKLAARLAALENSWN